MKKLVMATEEQIKQPSELAPSTTDETVSTPARLGITSRVFALIMAMRPRQWTKNLALFVGLVFAQRLFALASFERAALAFAAFCLASSFTYLLNDLLDLENDRQHPLKCRRPLASGSLPISWAVTTMGILLVGCIALTLLIFLVPIEPQQNLFASLGGANLLFAFTVASYLFLMVLYSIRLKHVVL